MYNIGLKQGIKEQIQFRESIEHRLEEADTQDD
jgi:hypothetical protein